jgi:tetratricopeptide (TPR) repeat protein
LVQTKTQVYIVKFVCNNESEDQTNHVATMNPTHCPLPHRTTSAHPAKSMGWKIAFLLVCNTLPLVSLADTTDFSPSAARGRQSIATPAGESLQLAPFKYVPPVGAEPVERIRRSPDQQRIIDLEAAGDYQAVGTEGLALMANEKPADELQLIIANSLAWTGRLKDAIPAYQGLADGPYASQAAVGLGNVYRWRGRDDKAMPLYRQALAADPDNAGAAQGLELASRELRPRTLLSFGGGSDSSDDQRRSVTLNHRWRDSSGSSIMEIETSAVRDTLPAIEAKQQDVTFRYQSLNLALKPSLELSMPTVDDHSLYGSARIKLFDDQVTLDGGRVNWGRMATNPNALAAHLSAMHAGIHVATNYSFGNLLAGIDYYDISDDNTVLAGNLQLTSAWRPLGKNVKPFVGVETRGAKYSTTSYWSPDQGSGTLYSGLLGEWGSENWNFYASGQVGVRLFGDAGTSWSLSAGGKLWVSRDIALSLNLWSLDSWRNNAAYRAQSATVNLEKLWR